LNDPERYQTVYAKEPGSAAAPTAGLHFTPRLLEELQVKGVKIAYVTLHVGLDTFAPVTEDDPETHKIHTEWCELPVETAEMINKTREAGGRIVAVGTTSVRMLESAARYSMLGRSYRIAPFTGPTDLFILPGLSILACGCDDHELPLAQVHVVDVGECVCRARKDFGNLRNCHQRRLSLLLIRGCDAYCLKVSRFERSNL